MIQQFAVGDLVHNIKTDEAGKVKEILFDTASATRYKVSVSNDAAKPGASAVEAVWDESDLIPSTHKAAS